jgi:hypothetical protein
MRISGAGTLAAWADEWASIVAELRETMRGRLDFADARATTAGRVYSVNRHHRARMIELVLHTTEPVS